MDLDSQTKPESEFISLIKQLISLAGSISNSRPELELVSLVTHLIPLVRSVDPEEEPEPELASLLTQMSSHLDDMDSDSELLSLLTQTVSVVESMLPESEPETEPESEPEAEPEREQLISLSPQYEVDFVDGRILVTAKVQQKSEEKRNCDRDNWTELRLTTGTHFRCTFCNGEEHGEYHKAPLEVKHPLHPKHTLHLVMWRLRRYGKCYCCDDKLMEIFYYCWDCNFAMNIACVDKQPAVSVDHPKWHEHALALFPVRTFLTCNLCALAHLDCPCYICPPCDFLVHQSCITLPRVIKISRHLHRISFTASFDQGDLFCGVCRTQIHNDYGGYSCIINGCSYAAHSRCATQSNVWDGEELEGKPEEIDEEGVEPFLRISNGIIQHFSHQQHHLRLDENTSRDYDENRLCQACITPIYFGNFYSCMQCDFILHEECANHSRKIQNPIHPHLLTLLIVASDNINIKNSCSACPAMCTSGFFYECSKEECGFKLHVQCATISEPLVHESHTHPLFLTSKPGERRTCGVCKDSRHYYTNETFNCITCSFSLCFGCATIPQKVMYKHDKHMLTLSYGKETSTMTYWCEACERKINPKERFYECGEYCCVTLHIECLIGRDLYMKPGSSWLYFDQKVDVLANNHCMSRLICWFCRLRCPYKVLLQRSGFIFCSTVCLSYCFWM